MPYDFKPFDEKVAASRDWLGREFQSIRTGRANPGVLDGVRVNAYGSTVPLKQVASIGVEDARTLRIQPYDPSLVKDIERGIAAADLGVGSAADSSGIRITFPDLTGERRQELVRLAKQTLEQAKATLRVVRDEVWKEIQEKERAGELTEDDKFSLKDELQKKMDAGNQALDEAFLAKEKEMQS